MSLRNVTFLIRDREAGDLFDPPIAAAPMRSVPGPGKIVRVERSGINRPVCRLERRTATSTS